MKKFIKVMKALSDSNRVNIIKLLQKRVLCVCEIRTALGIAQSTVSKHLKILEEAGLIIYTKDGQWVNYQLAEQANNPYAATMLESLRDWLENDTDVKELMSKLPTIRRDLICGM